MGSALTIGVFDGVHLGHQRIFSELLRVAGEEGLIPAVLTFRPHPRKTSIEKEGGLLLSHTERDECIRRYGIPKVFFLRFDGELKSMGPRDFFHRVIVDRFRARAVVVGSTHHFGRSGRGDPELLAELCGTEGIRFLEVPTYTVEGETVSSQRIRTLLSDGMVERAKKLLGRPHRVTGTVVHGTGAGASVVGYPTANVDPEPPERLIPASGVYGITVSCNGILLWGVANIGTAPTLHRIHDRLYTRLEVHLMNWSGDVYGKTVSVDFHVRLRDEYRFDTVAGLSKQIATDVGRARDLMSSEISGIGRSDTAGNATLP